ncbi:MAG TPA: gluconate 2-dehydrogenase subunit 3 family protein [Caulobacteraceae bacterium]|nr:gluconate 2-dehydrogenase subunit 3 family protein [Caulobacteraceae bacterium]
MAERFPGYNVLSKRDTLSFNAITRRVVDERVALPERDDVFTPSQRRTLRALLDRVTPQPVGRPPVNRVALIQEKVGGGGGDGYRHHQLPPLRDAWELGLTALDAEALARFATDFASLPGEQADALLRAVERGDAHDPAWRGMPPKVWWRWRVLADAIAAYYAHPSAWSAMGFGGPASPRGYVRLDLDRRDPWEAVQIDRAGADRPASARGRNRHVA